MCAMARHRRGTQLSARCEAFSDLPSHCECVFAWVRPHLTRAWSRRGEPRGSGLAVDMTFNVKSRRNNSQLVFFMVMSSW